VNRIRAFILIAMAILPILACESLLGISKATGGPLPENSQLRQDVSQYRSAGPSPRSLKVPAVLAKAITENPGNNIKELVQFLTEGETDPFQAIKNLHDWIALTISYDFKAFSSGSIPEQDPWSVLSSRKAVCAGYAALFQRFCELAGFRCTMVSGYSRGYRYDPFSEEIIAENHSWNAVKIADAWYLIDVTWDAGHIFNGRFQREYSTDYFLLPAEQMIYTHFPTTSTWQMLRIAVSTRQFLSMPHLEGRFFKYSFEGYTGLLKTYSCDGELAISLVHDPGIKIQAELRDNKERAVPQAVFIQIIQNGTDVLIRPQAAGQFELRVFAANLASRALEHVWSTGVDAVTLTGQGYPLQFEAYPAFSCRLVSPLSSPLKVGEIVEFDLVAKTDEILVVGGSMRREFSSDSDGRFVFSIEIPRIDRLQVFVREAKGNRYSGILQYRVIAP